MFCDISSLQAALSMPICGAKSIVGEWCLVSSLLPRIIFGQWTVVSRQDCSRLRVLCWYPRMPFSLKLTADETVGATVTRVRYDQPPAVRQFFRTRTKRYI
eukprot:scaffold39033_cov30-Prasinocladus_malaysianus.AAC.1